MWKIVCSNFYKSIMRKLVYLLTPSYVYYFFFLIDVICSLIINFCSLTSFIMKHKYFTYVIQPLILHQLAPWWIRVSLYTIMTPALHKLNVSVNINKIDVRKRNVWAFIAVFLSIKVELLSIQVFVGFS